MIACAGQSIDTAVEADALGRGWEEIRAADPLLPVHLSHVRGCRTVPPSAAELREGSSTQEAGIARLVWQGGYRQA